MQPLLEQIRLSLDTSASAAGLVSTLTQVGYTVGLLLLVPLGDVLRRRRLIVGLMLVEALFLVDHVIRNTKMIGNLASVIHIVQ